MPISVEGICAAIASTGANVLCASNKPLFKLEIAWPATSGANCKISGQLRSSGRSEGGCFFVPHVYPFDLLVVVNGVDNGV